MKRTIAATVATVAGLAVAVALPGHASGSACSTTTRTAVETRIVSVGHRTGTQSRPVAVTKTRCPGEWGPVMLTSTK